MNTPSYFHFSLAPDIYAGCFDNAIIILDAKKDNYVSLIDDAAHYFCLILKNQFMQDNNNQYYCSNASENSNTIHLDNTALHNTDLKGTNLENTTIDNAPLDNVDYNYWITYFIEEKLITPSHQPTFLKEPLKLGGLIEYRWDSKKLASWNPFSETSIVDAISAYYLLFKINRGLKRSGIAAIIDLLKKKNFEKNRYTPSEKEIKKLSAAIDAASLLYPKKIYCLAWAATFTILALKKGWRCNLAIGVQTNPFYAHAWAECENNVIHDDPVVAEVLSVIFKEPYR